MYVNHQPEKPPKKSSKSDVANVKSCQRLLWNSQKDKKGNHVPLPQRRGLKLLRIKSKALIRNEDILAIVPPLA